MMVKVVRYLTKLEPAVHRCLQPFTEKRLFMSILFIKVAGLQPKKRLHQRCFPVSLHNISEHLFCKTRLGGDWFCLNTIHFLCCVDLINKMLLSILAKF